MTQLPPQGIGCSTSPWVLASRERHIPKKPMDPELITRLADLRRQADGASSTSSSAQASLALLGSSVSITSSAFSQSFSVFSPPSVVEFPSTPVFTDAIPAGFMRKLELLSIGQTPNAPALNNSYHPLHYSNSIPRQQSMQRPAPTKSVPYYSPPSRPALPLQTKTPTKSTPSSNIAQQPSGLTFASTAAPRTTKPLSLQPSNHSPPPNKANFKAWWNHLTLVKSLKRDPFKGSYRGPSILSSSSHKPTNPACSALDTAEHPVFSKPLKESLRCASVRISLRTSTPNAHGDLYVWGFVPLVIAKWSVPSFFCLVFFPSDPHLGLQWPLSQGKRSVLVSCAVQCFLLSPFISPTATEVPGTFSVSGSNKRMRDLQAAFESPPRVSPKYPHPSPYSSTIFSVQYGKSLDWKKESYTTHDIASVFQRYLAQMPVSTLFNFVYHLDLISVCRNQLFLIICIIRYVFSIPSFVSWSCVLMIVDSFEMLWVRVLIIHFLR
jgi:hypothetical protein